MGAVLTWYVTYSLQCTREVTDNEIVETGCVHRSSDSHRLSRAFVRFRVSPYGRQDS